MEEKNRTVTIHFNNGEKLTIQFPQRTDEGTATALTEEMFRRELLSIDFGDRTDLIPLSSIQRLEIKPSLGTAVAGIKNARLVL